MLKRRARRRAIQQLDPIAVFDDVLADSNNQGMGHQIPPLIGYVVIYFYQQNMALRDAQTFFQHYEKTAWRTITGRPQKNWKVLAKDWIYNTVQQAKLLERQEAKRVAFPDI